MIPLCPCSKWSSSAIATLRVAGVENTLREFDVPYTILRLGYYIQNDGMLKGTLMGAGIYPVPIARQGFAPCTLETSLKPPRFL